MKKQFVKKLTKALTFCLCCIFCVGVLCCTTLTVFGADEPSDGGGSARITDLTGYTVTVPSGWSASAGFGEYNLIGMFRSLTFDSTEIQNFFIGYKSSRPVSNYVTVFETNSAGGITNYDNSYDIIIRIDGGNDVANSSLIQWFYDNNATFVNNNVPTTIQFTIFKDGVSHTCEFEDGMTLADWANSAYDTLGYAVVTGYIMVNGLYEERSFVASSFVEGECYRAYHSLEGGKGFVEPSNHIIIEGEEFYDYSNLNLYNECYANGYNIGYDKGYDIGEYQGDLNGYDRGYLQGITVGESSTVGQNLIGSGFSAITESLNQIIVYQSSTGTVVTLWVIVSGAIGIALFIWILKLFAGG